MFVFLSSSLDLLLRDSPGEVLEKFAGNGQWLGILGSSAFEERRVIAGQFAVYQGESLIRLAKSPLQTCSIWPCMRCGLMFAVLHGLLLVRQGSNSRPSLRFQFEKRRQLFISAHNELAPNGAAPYPVARPLIQL